MPDIIFFETQKGDRPYYQKHLQGQPLVFVQETLNAAELADFGKTEIISVFTHSNLSAEILSGLPGLKLIATRSTGFNHIDLNVCKERGITVSNVPFYGENTVAEHTFALLLSLSRNLHKAYLRTIKENFSLAGLQGFDLKGKTLGVIGAGRIGMHVIKMARGFDMNVLASDPKPDHFLAEILQFKYTSLEEALKNSDIISLHAPLNEKTHHLLNKENIPKIKKGALLINTARGELVETEALLSALNNGTLAGAGLDVLEGEEMFVEEEKLYNPEIPAETLSTIIKNHLLLQREDVVITPHIGFYSREALQRIRETTTFNILSYLSGQPQNTVTNLS